MHITEENFVSKLISRNEQAIEYVIQHYGWLIKTVIKKHLYNLPQYEEECINDILLAVWNNIERFDATKSNFKNWLAGIARFTALNYVRKYKKDIETESIDDIIIISEQTPYEVIAQEESLRDVEDIIKCLKEEDREIFIKLYIKEQSIQEISDDMGIKRDVLYNRVSRAKNKLKRIFTQKGGQ